MNIDSLMQVQENGGRGSRKRARTRAELLAAAQQVFAERGYHEASIAEITRLADVGVGTFYLHFRDKDEIFMTLIEEGIRDIREQVTGEAVRLPYEQQLPAIIRLTLRYAYAKRDLFRLGLTNGGQLTRRFRAQTALIEGFTDILEEAQRRGLIENAPLFACFITGIVMQSIVWWFEQDEPQPDIMTEQVMHLLRHGLPASFLSEDDESSKG